MDLSALPWADILKSREDLITAMAPFVRTTRLSSGKHSHAACTPMAPPSAEKVTTMDQFENHAPGLESPASRLFAIVPNDAETLACVTRAIAVDSDGYVQIVTSSGDTGRIFVAAGAPFPIRVVQVMASGTTATGIVGLA